MNIENYQRERLPFIDLLKGVCVILVVLYHYFGLWPLLSLMRIPLYFFLSGLFFTRYQNFRVFIIKRINRLVVPFLFFAIGSILYQSLGCVIKNDYTQVMFSNIFTEKMTINQPLWFLVSLFEISIISYYISLIKNNYIEFALVLAISFLGYLLGELRHNLYFFLDSSMTALVFFYFGSKIRHSVSGLFVKQKSDVAIVVVSGALFAATLFYVNPIDIMSNNYYGKPYLLLLLSSFSAIISLFYLCKRIVYISFINMYGRYSLLVMALHMPLHGIMYYFFPVGITSLVIIFIISLVIIYIAIKLMLNYFPQYIAQAPLFSLQNGRLFLNLRYHTVAINRNLNFRLYHKSIFVNN